MSNPSLDVAQEASTLAGKYLTFALGREGYAIPVLKVREIIRVAAITAVPQMPDYLKGVINLRGKIIPVLDLRLRLGMERAELSEKTCIIVVRIKKSDDKMVQTGLMVDGVEEVANIGAGDIEPTPEFGCQIDTAVIQGMAKVKGVVKTLLDIDRVVCGRLVGGTAPTDLYVSGAVAEPLAS